MELSKEILQELAKPLPANRISIKVQTKPNDSGSSLCVAYIDARDVMDRLDAVVGGDWSDVYRNAPSGGLECALTVCGVTRCDVGDDKNENETEKAGYSDAFKRAAVKFGIGRFLYDLPKMYGKVKAVGKNFYLESGEEQRLQKVIEAALNGKKTPAVVPPPPPASETINQETGAPTEVIELIDPWNEKVIAYAAQQWNMDFNTAAAELRRKIPDNKPMDKRDVKAIIRGEK